jgi:hypothetical protein
MRIKGRCCGFLAQKLSRYYFNPEKSSRRERERYLNKYVATKNVHVHLFVVLLCCLACCTTDRMKQERALYKPDRIDVSALSMNTEFFAQKKTP